MDDYIVSARKYRPMTFDSVVGQSALTTTLKNAVKSRKLAHAYLFCGPRGVGKTTCARIFAKAINCENPTADGEACNECESCKAFNEGRSLNIFELDAASNNSVENIRSLMEQTRIPPQIGRYKVFIIDEVHMLSTAAFNAFLKTLEEPPAHVIFILATTEKNKVLPTILSRCQIYDFERMTVANTVAHLKMVADKEGVTYEDAALEVIAEKADGGMRDALSIFDQAVSFSQGNITYEKVIEDLNVLDSDNYFNIIDKALENKAADIMVLLNNVINKGFDGGNLINGLASHVRNVLMAKDAQTLPLLEVSERQRQRYQQQAQKCPTKFLYRALQILNRCDVEYRQSSNKRLLVELTLIEVAQITQPDDDNPAAGRGPKRLKSLFKLLASNNQPKPAAQVAGAGKSLSPRASQRQGGAEAVAGAETNEPTATTAAPAAATTADQPSATAGKAVKTPKISLGSLGMSFNNLLKEKEKKNVAVQEYEITNKDEETKFSQTDLEREWRAMCVRMEKTAPGQAQRLKNIRPTITDYPNIEIVFDNKIFLDEIKPIQGRLRATMAKYLHNGNIQFSIRLARQEEIKPVLTPLENFERMKSENPAIKSLVEKLGLELA
ncbi:DNA polymerase III subunit gamma/tau [Prevotella lacticifex]|uniref:DNA polymerase III subunit gamma/tau n=1 Tax=Prevotella lacticifex TaxID=2854755 RepID=A0A9R1C9A5_9BACT|nr:DNA polymerase III subunit gamma/tau [Prevotella lacticifex]GJG35196.1 DNA polymerase III subunit gamma/tau [Prevotella lacticifex]GJG39753.1 DNA polymerase III subunit gamma/tau [Prevotella lacticifex]GJG41565.1 DNA polymerase III subunit gamma/tau [Prevotella lacticifex]GJG46109.1 DNA polymerase III subunit gamma/tau [Prevotella lacticifex]GJG47916.1 DNA polymerase III subunit gamma/tau [Prevotella lacticifex]